MTPAPLLTVRDLTVQFPRRGFRKEPFTAVDHVSLHIAPRETLGLVGESGSGKSTIGRAVLGLAPIASGEVLFRDEDITRVPKRRRRELSRDIQVIFQNPYSSLNPSLTIADILAEPLIAQGVGRTEARSRVRELLDRVHLPADAGARLPREFSGGQRQRVAIARALALRPQLIICDEPVSALDLTTQAHVMDLLIEIQEDTGVAYLFVSHDLDVVRHISHRVAVMRHGTLVETGTARHVTEHPEHPYTQRLLMSSPIPDPAQQRLRRERLEASAARPDPA